VEKTPVTQVVMRVRLPKTRFAMEKEHKTPTKYYVRISYEPYDVRFEDGTRKSNLCKYRVWEAWCYVGELTKDQAEVVRREFVAKWRSITEPKCQEPTCTGTILLLSEPDAVVKCFINHPDILRLPRQAIEHFEIFIRDQQLGFEQCQALNNCISFVNKVRTPKGCADKDVPNVTGQEIRVDLLSWESASTLEELSRVAGIEPTGEFDTEGWIAAYFQKIGFASTVQDFESVAAVMFGSVPAGKSAENVVKEEMINIPDVVIELLKKTNTLIEKNTIVTKKGFESLKPVDHQSFAELVKTLPLLRMEKEDENWILATTVKKHTGETLESLKKQRQRGEIYPYEGVIYGRDTEERIWCQVSKSRKVFYLASHISGQAVSR